MDLRAVAVSMLFAAVGLLGGTTSAWSQGGLVTVFERDLQVLIDRGDGLGPQPLVSGEHPSLSLDRRFVTFRRDDGLYTIGADGDGLRKVLDPAAFRDAVGGEYRLFAWPAWTPDGRSLVFSWSLAFDLDLGMVSSDGSDPRLLTRLRGIVASDSWPTAFSPDGRRLLQNSSESLGLFVTDLMDGSRVRLTGAAEAGSWSPDGLWVAFAWGARWMDETGNSETGLEAVRVDGSARRDLAAAVRAGTGGSFEPVGPVTWSADGAEVAVLNRADGHLYAVAADGSGARQVAWHFAPFAYPASAVESTSWGEAKARVRP